MEKDTHTLEEISHGKSHVEKNECPGERVTLDALSTPPQMGGWPTFPLTSQAVRGFESTREETEPHVSSSLRVQQNSPLGP